jgi:hypothetical protein
MSNTNEINEFEAAALLQMSPTLLQAFTQKAPKKGESRKLSVRQVGATRTYGRSELRDFDDYLRKPWPSNEGKRPHIPAAIRKEVQLESFLQCAVCHSNADTCEVAHIEPLAASKCNHPHNLILLCANHHTKIDKQGVLGPRSEVRDVVRSFKATLLYVTRVKWEAHASSIADCYSIAQLCARLKKEIEAAQHGAGAQQVQFFEGLAGRVISRLRSSVLRGKLQNQKQSRSDTSEELWSKLEKSVAKRTVRAQLASAADLTQDEQFRAAAGFVDCPLCEGAGAHGEQVCPVCSGERQVESAVVARIDLKPYKLVKCPLCEGNGKHEGEGCPVCSGDRRIERRFAEQVDLAEFDDVECPLCGGSGRWDGDDCPECHGSRTMPRRFADRVNVHAYEKVACPVCRGDGRDPSGESCRPCGGEGRMTRHLQEQTDVADYKSLTCRLCEGSGTFLDGSCPPCNGEGSLPRWAADQIDWSEFDLINCPDCRGRGSHAGEECCKCGGEGKLLRRFVNGDW